MRVPTGVSSVAFELDALEGLSNLQLALGIGDAELEVHSVLGCADQSHGITGRGMSSAG
ncbi:hypothetical protein DFR68_111122 [Nocardia mexicana]|uniref:Uncharacterized protein n=1 Tax=Nocardia mexicana TaxID=279262 RepID=A0A370GUW6_9NOCA|nr:hypothetical protein DFR68_111122 [Nocardia mexicana]